MKFVWPESARSELRDVDSEMAIRNLEVVCYEQNVSTASFRARLSKARLIN